MNIKLFNESFMKRFSKKHMPEVKKSLLQEAYEEDEQNIDLVLDDEEDETLEEGTTLNPGGHYQPKYEKEIKQRLRSFLFNKGYDTDSEEVKNYISAAAELIGYSPDEYSVEEWYKDTLENYPEDLAALPKLSKKFRKALQSDPDLDYIRYSLEYGDDDFDESLNEDVYRQYEDPYALEDEYNQLKAYYDMHPDEKDDYAEERLASLSDRINFAWQDDEYDSDYYRNEFYDDLYEPELISDDRNGGQWLESLDEINLSEYEPSGSVDGYETYRKIIKDKSGKPRGIWAAQDYAQKYPPFSITYDQARGYEPIVTDHDSNAKILSRELGKKLLPPRGYNESYKRKKKNLKDGLNESWSGVFSVRKLMQEFGIDKNSAKKLSDYLYDNSYDDGFNHQDDALDFYRDEIETKILPKITVDESLDINKLGWNNKDLTRFVNWIDRVHGENYYDLDDDTIELYLDQYKKSKNLKEGNEEDLAETYRQAIIDWMYDHPQALDDIQSQMGVRVEDVSLNGLKAWIAQHKQLKADFENYFHDELGESYKRKKKNLKESLGSLYTVVIGFAGYSAFEESYEVYADSEEEAVEEALQRAEDDLYVDEVNRIDDITFSAIVNFGGYIGLEETYKVDATDKDEAIEEALDQATNDLEVLSVDLAEDEEDLDESCGKKKKLDELVAGRKLTGGSMERDDRAVIQPIIDAIAAFEEEHENEFFITWNFGRRASDNKMTAGVDINFSGPVREDEEQKEAYVNGLLDVINQNGYIMDPALGYDESGPREGIFGGFHYQIVEADEDPDFFREALEGSSNTELIIQVKQGLNADGFTATVMQDGEKVFSEEYNYGYNASYSRTNAEMAARDVQLAKEYGWKGYYKEKPYTSDIIKALCAEYNIPKSNIKVTSGRNVFRGDEVNSEDTQDFIDEYVTPIMNESLAEDIDDQQLHLDATYEKGKGIAATLDTDSRQEAEEFIWEYCQQGFWVSMQGLDPEYPNDTIYFDPNKFDETVVDPMELYDYSDDYPAFVNEAAEEETEDDDDFELDAIEQEFTSKNTSVNNSRLPAVFAKVDFKPGTINLDYGGGKFDNATEKLAERDVVNLIYDKYNRTPEWNRKVIKQVRANGGADTATCCNVLNVIKEPEERLNVIRNISRLLKPGGTAYFYFYKGDNKGVGRQTGKDSYQLNRKNEEYLDEIKQIFSNAKPKSGMIVATNGGSANESLRESKKNSLDSQIWDIYGWCIEKDINADAQVTDAIDDYLEELGKPPFEDASDVEANLTNSQKRELLSRLKQVKKDIQEADTIGAISRLVDMEKNPVNEEIPGGQYYEPGLEDANDDLDDSIDNYDDEDFPFDEDFQNYPTDYDYYSVYAKSPRGSYYIPERYSTKEEAVEDAIKAAKSKAYKDANAYKIYGVRDTDEEFSETLVDVIDTQSVATIAEAVGKGSKRSVYDSVRDVLERGEAPAKRMIANAGVGSEISFLDTSAIDGTDRVVTYTKINDRQWQYSPSHQPVKDRYSNTVVAARLYYAFTGRYDHPDNVEKIELV